MENKLSEDIGVDLQDLKAKAAAVIAASDRPGTSLTDEYLAFADEANAAAVLFLITTLEARATIIADLRRELAGREAECVRLAGELTAARDAITRAQIEAADSGPDMGRDDQNLALVIARLEQIIEHGSRSRIGWAEQLAGEALVCARALTASTAQPAPTPASQESSAMSDLAKLKRTARSHYEAYRAATSHLDCGAAMAEYIRPDAAQHRVAFNNTMDELAKLDPSAPTKRL